MAKFSKIQQFSRVSSSYPFTHFIVQCIVLEFYIFFLNTYCNFTDSPRFSVHFKIKCTYFFYLICEAIPDSLFYDWTLFFLIFCKEKNKKKIWKIKYILCIRYIIILLFLLKTLSWSMWALNIARPLEVLVKKTNMFFWTICT